ncbi:cryptochrome/photolyase family protein [Kordiimonas sp.]|uniref:cryptochrome/photolyase family protein n=1 Tax=Kordiimonas sp. TaxID=1970157 RepID=UPI003A915AFD
MKPVIILMNGAIRLDDHPALARARDTGAPVIPVFILDDASAGAWRLGGARRWWLLKSLSSLQASLRKAGSGLVLRYGDTIECLKALISAADASAVHMTRSYEPEARKVQDAVHDLCKDLGVSARRFSGNLLLEPEQIRNKTGGIYEVFSPFWRRAQELIDDTAPVSAPVQLRAPENWPVSDDLSKLELEPKPAYWAEPIAAFWTPGEEAARERLNDFLKGAVLGYKDMRDYPATDATSRLSPYLANGEISPRRIWHETMIAIGGDKDIERGGNWFLRELGWREFSSHLLYHFPHIPQRALKSKFTAFPWREGHDEKVAAWQKGMTGFPIIDAGMRQLWQTGWMHNRVRMIVASFLVKDMLWHWRTGEDWFWDTLVDADLANNAASWQWVAGCGADAAPYFRIFNPITQGEKFDSRGAYIREYVPELAELPDEYIHKPFEAPAGVLKMAGIKLGETYPKPILDRKAARERALAALATTRQDS